MMMVMKMMMYDDGDDDVMMIQTSHTGLELIVDLDPTKSISTTESPSVVVFIGKEYSHMATHWTQIRVPIGVAASVSLREERNIFLRHCTKITDAVKRLQVGTYTVHVERNTYVTRAIHEFQ